MSKGAAWGEARRFLHVQQIRADRPAVPLTVLAERYGVSRSTISEVANVRHWKGREHTWLTAH